MSTREWKALPSSEREYLAYLHAARKLGAPEEELTRKFFMSLEPTEREKFVRAALKDPKLMAGAERLAKAARTQISIGQKVAGKVAEKKALGEISGQLYFAKGEDSKDFNKYINDIGAQRQIFMASKAGADPIGSVKEKAKLTIDWYKKTIIAKGGKIIDEKWSEDGNTKIWTIKWKDGTTEEIRRDLSS